MKKRIKPSELPRYEHALWRVWDGAMEVTGLMLSMDEDENWADRRVVLMAAARVAQKELKARGVRWNGMLSERKQ